MRTSPGMGGRRVAGVVVLAVAALGLVVPWGEVLGQRSCGPPPRAKPKRRTAGESFPPLPLPATPLRRSEQKRQPAPPALVGKVAYAPARWITRGGRRYLFRDWTTDPADISNLLNWTNSQLGIRYRSVQLELDKFSYDPAEMPIMYFTGHEPVRLSPETIARIRRYVLDGGYLVGDACCGSKEFYTSFRALVKAAFPRREIFALPDDHPLYSAYYRIRQVQYQEEGKGRYTGPPVIYGVNVGCRTAVFFWPADLSCGWDGHIHKHGFRVLFEIFKAIARAYGNRLKAGGSSRLPPPHNGQVHDGRRG